MSNKPRGYKQATKADLETVVAPMVERAAEALNERLAGIDNRLAILASIDGGLQKKADDLTQLLGTLQRELESEAEIRQQQSQVAARQALQAQSYAAAMSSRQDAATKHATRTDGSVALLAERIASLETTQKEIQDTLIASREKAINQLAHALSKSLVSVLNDVRANGGK